MSSKYRQGIFTPVNQDKFIGNKAIYRSGLELRFMRFCDSNDNVLRWGSENVIIPYISPLDGRVHKYYVDNFVIIKEGEIIKKYLIEIKPSSQTAPPKPPMPSMGQPNPSYESSDQIRAQQRAAKRAKIFEDVAPFQQPRKKGY